MGCEKGELEIRAVAQDIEVNSDGTPISPSSDTLPTTPPWTPQQERALVRKIDTCLLPMLWIMSLVSWMDRSNLGNAYIAGLGTDLQISSSQYSMAIITYYIGYILIAPVCSLILPRVRPSFYLSIITGLWGIVTAATSCINTYPQLLVSRLLVGLLESGLSPGMIFIFSCWYLPSEFGKRTAWFITSAQIGGLFGGLMAGGLMERLEGRMGLTGWRWLFVVEGAITVVISMVAVFVLPDFPGREVRGFGRRFSEEERLLAVGRLERAGIVTLRDGNGNSETGGMSSGVVTATDGKVKLAFGDIVRGTVRDWRSGALWAAAGFQSAALVLIYFFPALVRGLGYTDPIKAQYMTAPIWAVSLVMNIVGGYVADLIPRYRGLVLAGSLFLLSAMAITICAVYDITARYVLICFMTGGLFISYGQILALPSELFGHMHPQIRSFSIGIITMASQTGYIYAAYLFPAENAPKHLLGFGVVAATSGICGIGHVFIWWFAYRGSKK